MAASPTDAEVDEALDALVTDCIGGGQTGSEDKKPADTAAQASKGAGSGADTSPFSDLSTLFQGDVLQKVMSEALAQMNSKEPPSSDDAAAPDLDGHVVKHLASFHKKFEDDMDSNPEFAGHVQNMIRSSMSVEVLKKPVEDIVQKLEPWLKQQTGLTAAEKLRHEKQLDTLRQVLEVYKMGTDSLPEAAQKTADLLVQEALAFGPLPDAFLKEVSPEQAEDGNDTFEDFMRSMNLADGLQPAEQDLLKKLTSDPEDLTGVIRNIAGRMSEQEECKQQ